MTGKEERKPTIEPRDRGRRSQERGSRGRADPRETGGARRCGWTSGEVEGRGRGRGSGRSEGFGDGGERRVSASSGGGVEEGESGVVS